MYYLTLISDKTERLNFCKKTLPPDTYLVSTITWDELLDQADQLRQADVVIADLSDKSQNAAKLFSHLQQEIKLYEIEVSTLLLLTLTTLEQISHTTNYDDFLLLPSDEIILQRTQKELLIRLKLLLKVHGKEDHKQIVQIQELAVDLDKYEVRKAGQVIPLTFKEYELLKYLITHPDRVFTRESLLNAVWGYDYYGGTRTVDVHVRRIRSKLGDEEEHYIKTIWGVGYRFLQTN